MTPKKRRAPVRALSLLFLAGVIYFMLSGYMEVKITNAEDPPGNVVSVNRAYELNERALELSLSENESGKVDLESMIPTADARIFRYEFYAKNPAVSLCYSPRFTMLGYGPDASYCTGYRVSFLSKDGGKTRYEEVRAVTDSFIEKLSKRTDREKIKEAASWIKDRCRYAKNPQDLWSESLYGCLVKGEATCLGYSEAFLYLMDRLDVPCYIECSKYHAWNAVYDGTKWIKVDLTKAQPVD